MLNSKELALLASLLFAVNPLFWLISECALSDVMGASLIFLALTFLYFSTTNPKLLVVSAIAFSLSLGTRMNNYAFFPLFIYVIFSVKSNKKIKVFSVLVFLIITSLWFLLMIHATGGFKNWFVPTLGQFEAVSYNSLIAFDGLDKILKELFFRIVNYISFISGFAPLLFQIGKFVPFQWEYNAIILISALVTLMYLAVGFLGLILKFKKNKFCLNLKFNTVFFLLWIFYLVYMLVQIHFLPRYALPIIPLFYLFLIIGLQEIFPKKLKFYLIPLIISLLILGFYCVNTNTYYPPSLQAVKYVNENFDTNAITVFSSEDFSHFQYYAPNINLVFLMNKDLFFENADRLLKENKTILLSGKYTAWWLRQDNRMEKYTVELIKEFQMDPFVCHKNPETAIYKVTYKY